MVVKKLTIKLNRDSLHKKKVESLLEIGYKEWINQFQLGIIKECLRSQSGGLSLPMGSGKTFISLMIGLEQIKNNQHDKILVVCAKTLIPSWENEIKKFFGDKFPYTVFHSERFKKNENMNRWTIPNNIKLVITNGETLAKFYRLFDLEEHLIEKRFLDPNVAREMWGRTNPYYNPDLQPMINFYRKSNSPFINHRDGGGLIFSIKWKTFIIDEAQCFTNILCSKGRSLAAVSAENRWLLSGTLFNEPKSERILGYYLLLNYQGDDIPRNLPEFHFHIRSGNYKGFRSTIVHRPENDNFKKPTINQQIISHQVSFEEAKIYTSFKESLISIQKKINGLQWASPDVRKAQIKIFSSYRMAVVTYLRQSLVCPLLPIASISLGTVDSDERTSLSNILLEEIRKMEIDYYFDNVESVKSSRIKSMLEQINKHPNERIVIFSCFSTCLDIIQQFLPKDRTHFRITGSMSLKRREQEIEKYSQDDNAILILSYQIGAEGLNLQMASTVLLMDFWWNAGKVKQAIARLLRWGQQANTVNIYFFTSNTGIENIIFKKQQSKLIALNQLETGSINVNVPKCDMKEIVKLLEIDQNADLINNIHFC